jgi:SAM-dependent methyltransferase
MDLREATDPARRHPWERARSRFFRQVLDAGGRLRGRVDVLDVGAGDGWLGRELAGGLAPGSTVTCVDANYTDAWLDAHPGDARVRYRRSPPPGRFDLLLLLDVLEHVVDDRGFLRGFVADHLAPGGAALVSVPAWAALFSDHDRWLGHHRRYRPAQARAVLSAAGLRIQREGGLFHSLLLPRALATLGERVRPAREPAAPAPWAHGAAATALAGAALRVDNACSREASLRGWTIPGLSWWALCTA